MNDNINPDSIGGKINDFIYRKSSLQATGSFFGTLFKWFIYGFIIIFLLRVVGFVLIMGLLIVLGLGAASDKNNNYAPTQTVKPFSAR